MRKPCFRLLVLTFVITTITDVLLAQYGYEACVVVLKGQNRNRTVAGAVNKECGVIHDAPWGNWGVNSNYGPVYDGDQFKGWKPKGVQHQWNSCTTDRPKFRAPNCDFYLGSGCNEQYSNNVVTHGIVRVQTQVRL